MEAKSPSESRTILSQLVLPSHANPEGSMHGGELVKLMDSAAGVVARRHCLGNIVTVSIENLLFTQAVMVGDLVICDAKLVYTGTTSMQIYVKVTVEKLNLGEQKMAVEGYFTFHSMDESGNPIPVPPLKS